MSDKLLTAPELADKLTELREDEITHYDWQLLTTYMEMAVQLARIADALESLEKRTHGVAPSGFPKDWRKS